MSISAILSLREASALKLPAPHSYTLTSESRKLFMFGAVHFRPPGDPQFATMQAMWDEFKASDVPKIALVEPGIGPIGATLERTIESYGEAGATQWLGLRDGIGIVCADLEYRQLLASLAETFDGSDVAYWVLCREMDNYFRSPGGRTADEVLAAHLTRYRKRFNEIGVAGDRAWFDAKHAQVSGGKAIDDKSYWDFVNSWSAPTVLVDIIEAESRLRNEHVFGIIRHLLELGNDVFVTYGATHAIQLEPALRAIMVE